MNRSPETTEGITLKDYSDYIKDIQTKIEETIKSQNRKNWYLAIGGANLLWIFVVIWAAVSPVSEDLIRMFAIITLTVLIVEIVMFTSAGDIAKRIKETNIKFQIKTIKSLMKNAIFRVVTLRALYLISIGLLWSRFDNIIGYIVILIFILDIIFAVYPLIFLSDEQISAVFHKQMKKLEKPYALIIVFGIIPLMIFLSLTWDFVIAGRAIYSLQFALLLSGILFIIFYITLYLISVSAQSQIAKELGRIRVRIFNGNLTSVESVREAMTKFLDEDSTTGTHLKKKLLEQ
jgi:hypothetical protein